MCRKLKNKQKKAKKLDKFTFSTALHTFTDDKDTDNSTKTGVTDDLKRSIRFRIASFSPHGTGNEPNH